MIHDPAYLRDLPVPTLNDMQRALDRSRRRFGHLLKPAPSKDDTMELLDRIAIAFIDDAVDDAGSDTRADCARQLGISEKEYTYEDHYPALIARKCYRSAAAFLAEREKILAERGLSQGPAAGCGSVGVGSVVPTLLGAVVGEGIAKNLAETGYPIPPVVCPNCGPGPVNYTCPLTCGVCGNELEPGIEPVTREEFLRRHPECSLPTERQAHRAPSPPSAKPTERQAHEDAAGMNLDPSFFTRNGINPDAVVSPPRGPFNMDPDPEDAKYPPKGGWAPGRYQCQCGRCGVVFIGDKRATTCRRCAYPDTERNDQ